MLDDDIEEMKNRNSRRTHVDEYGVLFEVLSRKDVNDYLKKYVSGQEKLLDKLSFIAHLYSKKVLQQKKGTMTLDQIPKLNFLITGPTGCGKTHIIKTLAKCLEVTYHRIDCSTVTGEGWKGNNLSDRLAEFTAKSPSGVGIVHLDEFDKLGLSEGASASSSGADFGLDKQTGLLDLLDGSHSAPAGDRTPSRLNKDTSAINNCLVILTGSFQSFRDTQKSVKLPIGFNGDPDENKVIIKSWRKELTKLGFIPELANRILSSAELDPYTKEDIRRILNNTDNNAYEKHTNIALDGDDYVQLPQSKLDEIVEAVHASESGMRELESLLFEAIYESEINSRDENS